MFAGVTYQTRWKQNIMRNKHKTVTLLWYISDLQMQFFGHRRLLALQDEKNRGEVFAGT